MNSKKHSIFTGDKAILSRKNSILGCWKTYYWQPMQKFFEQ